ncbi:MAG: hypothetical protein JOZ54_04960 [Acidobacteria bacterium]|nr:hypothetical protein [Acidobacteriota bacterium]
MTTPDTPTPAGFGTSSATDTGSSSFGAANTGTDLCPTCGQSKNRGLEQFLGKLGITDDMINNLKTSFQNVDVDEYMNTARDYLKSGGDYLKSGSDKATNYAKENPGTVAAGAAVLAVGAGLLIRALTKD